MTPNRLQFNDLGSAHLNVAAFLIEIDERHGIQTVPEATRLAVQQAIERRRQQEAHVSQALGGLINNSAETAIL